ncbi:MAG: hypothetical protein JO113_04170, partial [Candidatus Eremiobacteraeota bacterium]|nr:hypothetical protein [Candidatus Eremiobacteraeota bacterium]
GKQSVSIVNGLYVGQMLGTMANAGVPRATFWLAYGSCDETGDYSKKLYGWQRFGSEALFSDGLPNPYEGCSSTPKIAGGTPFPTARVMGLMAADVPAGSQARGVSVSATSRNSVRAYGFAQGSGFTFAIFNNTLSPIAAQALVKGSSQKNYDATLAIYGKAQYDQSKQNKWVGPVQRSLGRVGPSVRLTLGPYSLSMLRLR